MRMTSQSRRVQASLAHGGLDGLDVIGLKEGLGVGQRAVCARPLVPSQAAREE